ncbi:MAG: serine/threonine protein kinase, partial [Deltaproteobacteria bacterium]|nr:serine/threonine protein kinase [Deltaproteobacteria bacterium]MBW2537366.1 serine/threonine protein kinase [Deltaproteobacteria bacterium]
MPIEPGTYVTDKVRLISMMREGSMGQVWLAEHESLKTKVVVKFIAEDLLESRPDARGRFEKEASTTARIKSPHVIQIFDYGEMESGTPYQVMELLQGESVGDRIDREGHIPPTDVGEILRQAGNALDLAHGHGIIHRDIKPQNLNIEYVHGELHVKVLDFGIAKRTLDDSSQENLTLPGMVVGTLEYLSREVVSGSDQADYRVDLWALAVVAYKALTGQLPFTGPGMVQICTAIREGKFRRPSKIRPELPPAIDNWFMRAFFPDPEGRFTSATQMARAFKEAIDESPSAGVYAAPSEGGARKPSQFLLAGAIGGGAIAVVVFVIALAVFGFADDDSTAPSTSATVTAAADATGAAPSASGASTAVSTTATATAAAAT